MKLFGTDGIRGNYGTFPIDENTAERLGGVFASFLGNGAKIGIGGDTRASTEPLTNAFIRGLVTAGATVLFLGVLPTPGVGYLVKKYELDGGIVISASHNPPQQNGFKFFRSDGFKLNETEESKIEKMFASEDKFVARSAGRIDRKEEDAFNDYKNHLKKAAKKDFYDIKIVVDPGNGAASYIGEELFTDLGAEVVMINNKPDGTNINNNCGALYCHDMAQTVKIAGAHIGVAFDGDADRVIVADELGNNLDGDYIMAIIGTDMLLEKKLKNATLVATQYSNLALKKTIEKAGGTFVTVENGDRYVVAEMLRRGSNFGGEKTGHIIFMDSSTTGDGLLTAVTLVNLMIKHDKKLSELTHILKLQPQLIMNIKINKKIPIEELPELKAKIGEAQKMLVNKGRVFVRYSGTENILRVMLEGEDGSMLKQLASSIQKEAEKVL